MHTSDFSFELPEELIAQAPTQQRDHSRLMVLNRATQEIIHRQFFDLPAFLRPGDVLVLNDSKVIPARLFGKKTTGGGIEILLVRPADTTSTTTSWECMVRGKQMKAGMVLEFEGLNGKSVSATLTEQQAGFLWVISFAASADDFRAFLDVQGQMPLPPYIKHTPLTEAQLRETYQTIYARQEGSVAAPTAGLHFSPAVLEQLQQNGVVIEYVTLHVGLGTFLPVKTERVEEHTMHAEEAIITPETAERINAAKADGRRVIAVGTTSVRTLESFMANGVLQSGKKMTSIFITPGYTFQCVDGMITNFHLPQSTLLMLVSAFAGTDFIKRAYDTAVRERYRFYSFGDAMLIL